MRLRHKAAGTELREVNAGAPKAPGTELRAAHAVATKGTRHTARPHTQVPAGAHRGQEDLPHALHPQLGLDLLQEVGPLEAIWHGNRHLPVDLGKESMLLRAGPKEQRSWEYP